jgi:hypothetical protein
MTRTCNSLGYKIWRCKSIHHVNDIHSRHKLQTTICARKFSSLSRVLSRCRTLFPHAIECNTAFKCWNNMGYANWAVPLLKKSESTCTTATANCLTLSYRQLTFYSAAPASSISCQRSIRRRRTHRGAREA